MQHLHSRSNSLKIEISFLFEILQIVCELPEAMDQNLKTAIFGLQETNFRCRIKSHCPPKKKKIDALGSPHIMKSCDYAKIVLATDFQIMRSSID